MTNSRKLQRLPTGVPGLDDILGGGLFESGMYAIQGSSGSGKTILANQICFHQAAQGQRAVYYTLLTESHDRMIGFMQQLRFVDPSKIASGVIYLSGFKVLEADGMPGVLRNVRDVVGQHRPTVLVIDGISTVEELAASNLAFRKLLHELQTAAAMFRCTVLLLTNTEAATRLDAEHTMVDGILHLRSEVVRLQERRTLEVLKLRGARQTPGAHSMEITDDGVLIHPRIERMLVADRSKRRPTERVQLAFGVSSIDAALHGGLLTASNTMVLGASGSGKTILGMQLLDGGAAAGERGLFFTFYEKPEELVAKARRTGMEPFARGVESGTIKVVWQSSVEVNIDRLASELVEIFAAHQPKRVFIDGMHGFQTTLDPPERIQDFFAALVEHFISHEAVFMFSAETFDLVGDAVRPPFANASRMCQNIILLRFAELGGQLQRVWSIIKMRDTDYDPALRILAIGEHGIELGHRIDAADMVLVGQPRRAPRGG